MTVKAKTNQQKTLIKENENQASNFTTELEATYLQAVILVFDSIKELGIENPSKSLLFDTIQGNFGQLEAVYEEITRADIEGFKSPAARQQMADIFTEKLNEVKAQVKELFSGVVGNQYAGGGTFVSFDDLTRNFHKYGTIPMNDTRIAEMVDIVDGVPVIADESKEVIREAFRDYATPEEAKISEAQIKAAEALEQFAGTLTDAGIKIDFDFAQAFFIRYFNYQRNDETGRYEISARIQGVR